MYTSYGKLCKDLKTSIGIKVGLAVCEWLIKTISLTVLIKNLKSLGLLNYSAIIEFLGHFDLRLFKKKVLIILR